MTSPTGSRIGRPGEGYTIGVRWTQPGGGEEFRDPEGERRKWEKGRTGRFDGGVGRQFGNRKGWVGRGTSSRGPHAGTQASRQPPPEIAGEAGKGGEAGISGTSRRMGEKGEGENGTVRRRGRTSIREPEGMGRTQNIRSWKRCSKEEWGRKSTKRASGCGPGRERAIEVPACDVMAGAARRREHRQAVCLEQPRQTGLPAPSGRWYPEAGELRFLRIVVPRVRKGAFRREPDGRAAI